jgi:hypothetical protein
MEAQEIENEKFDEKKSLQVIMEMIEVSREKLRNDGILFIIWGWALFYSCMSRYLVYKILFSNMQMMVFKYVEFAFTFFVFAYTIYYLWRQRKKAQTYVGISLRYVWTSTFICMVLINQVLNNTMHTINFELQHPIFMLLTAFAAVVSGGILRYWWMIAGGILFGLLAYLASFFELHDQLLLEGIAWFLAFILPGHILFAKRLNE